MCRAPCGVSPCVGLRGSGGVIHRATRLQEQTVPEVSPGSEKMRSETCGKHFLTIQAYSVIGLLT